MSDVQPTDAAVKVVTSAEQLDEMLYELNDQGTAPVVVGFNAHGSPFLAYGWAPGGDGWDCGFVNDDTHSAEFDYTDGTERCHDCGAFDRRPITKLSFPVTVVRAATGGTP